MEQQNWQTVLAGVMKKALRSVPESVRREYDEAMRVVPHLVRLESKTTDFCQVENFDLYQAACRLSMYWKARKYLFGADRWLLPLDQTGRGALSPDDVALLRTGYYVLQPRPPHGVLILFDETRLPRAAGHTTTRLVFYFTHLYGDFTAQGITFVHVVKSGNRPPPEIQQESWDIYRSALPIRVEQRIVVAQAYEPDKPQLLQYLSFQTQRTAQFRSRLPVDLIAGNSLGQTLHLLQDKHGLDRAFLPACLGGSFDYCQFDDWIRMRISIEGAMTAAPVLANCLPKSSQTTPSSHTQLTPPTQQQQYQSLQLSIKEDSTHALSTMPQHLKQQQQQHRKLDDDSTLNKPMQRVKPSQVAGAVEATVSPNTTSPKKKKRMDTYDRRRLLLKRLQQESGELQEKNSLVKQKNRALEHCLAQARLIVATALAGDSSDTAAEKQG